MAALNKAKLIAQVADCVYRADTVRRDPAVRKAAHRFAEDLSQAAKSLVKLGNEARTAWHRAPGPGPAWAAAVPA